MKTIEDRLTALESRMTHAESALHDLGMRPVHYPGKTRPTYEWMHERAAGLVKLPHPVEGEVFVKCGFLGADYVAEVINLCEDDIDPVGMLTRAGQFAFNAWRNAGPERDCIAKWIPEIVASRGDYGQCRPAACLAWAERMVREHERERVATLYQHGAIGHDSYESGTRNIEDGNVHLIEA